MAGTSPWWWHWHFNFTGAFQKILGTPNHSWMVSFMENPKQKWMMWGYSYLRKPPFTWENDDQPWDFGKDRWRKAWDNFQGGNGFPAKSSKLLIIFDGNNPMVWGSTRILGINMCIEPRSSAFAFAAIRQEPGNQFGKRLWWIQVLTIPNFTWNGLWMPSKDVHFLVC
jgi:hypothetical protein